MVERTFPVEEYEARRARVEAEMRRRGYSACVVWGRGGGFHERGQDTLYLTNYYSAASGQEPDNQLLNARSFCALLLEAGQEPELHVDLPGRRPELFAIDRVEDHYDPVAGVAAALKRRRIEGRVALVGSDILPLKYGRQLEAATPAITWVPEDDLVARVRRLKSARELEMYREGGAIATRAITRYMEGLIAGKREADCAADAASEIMRAGGGFLMLPCNHGTTIQYWVRQPLYGYSTDAPKPGDIVRGWLLGPVHQGYYLDPGRTAVCGGRPAAAQKELIEATAGIVERVIAAMKPGAKIMEIARLGERLTREAGGGDDQTSRQWPIYGHGLGLFWEDPYISTQMCAETDTVELNMVFGIEAFLGREGVGAAGFEQNIMVTERGTEILTTAPMIWW
ncbi:MAG TPA: Xaa-Pro peptidase family protein [Alphaproteobacteria bacterium]|nr:Xaa-Pro peptidase family protein [Alphaproteobacteria bacterium]